MQKFTFLAVRTLARLPRCVATVSLCFLCVAPIPVVANPATTVIRVEEDWELQVDTPDSNSAGPQVTCTFSPDGSVNSVHAALELNHQSLPEFVPGGIQLQLWNDEAEISSHKFPNGKVLATSGEVIRWTQTMEIKAGQLTFEIIGGHSTTWEKFGGQGYLKTTLSTTLPNLNLYNPKVSVEQSGVGYAANRVKTLRLKEVRVHTQSGEVYSNTTNHIVFPRD